MARVLGYGGIGNSNGARDFSGKSEAAPVAATNRSVLAIAVRIGLGIALYLGVS